MINKQYWPDLKNTKVMTLNDKKLNEYIENLQAYYEEDKKTIYSADQLNALLHLAVNERSGRSNSNLARISIAIAVLSIIISALGIWLSQCQ